MGDRKRCETIVFFFMYRGWGRGSSDVVFALVAKRCGRTCRQARLGSMQALGIPWWCRRGQD